MTPATIALIEERIIAARKRGDGREVAVLRAELPFEERQRIFGVWVTAAGRAPLSPAQVKESAGQTTTAAWPSSVRIRESVLREIRNLDFDGREEAGFLVGSTESGEVLDFFLAHDEDAARWGSCKLDLERCRSVLQGLNLDRTVVGEFHTHPNGAGVHASNQDITSAVSLAKAFGRPWVSLIVSAPDNPSAIRTDVAAYLTDVDGNHRTVNIETRSF